MQHAVEPAGDPLFLDLDDSNATTDAGSPAFDRGDGEPADARPRGDTFDEDDDRPSVFGRAQFFRASVGGRARRLRQRLGCASTLVRGADASVLDQRFLSQSSSTQSRLSPASSSRRTWRRCFSRSIGARLTTLSCASG
jgi:hypothetical protein